MSTRSDSNPRHRRAAAWPALCAFVLLAALPSASPNAALAGDPVPTQLVVRVLAKDAKFVGSSMGGARVIVRDADSGEILAEGVTMGSTGNTARIMKEDWKRGGELSVEGSAKFATTLMLDRPRHLEISACGPQAQLQSANRVSVTQWVVPGKHLDQGDAILLVMPGFAVDILAPAVHARVGAAPRSVRIEANVVMMCGCPIEPGGLWDADRFEVVAVLNQEGRTVAELPLEYAGITSRFAAEFGAEAAGAYEVMVYAYDPSNGNTGIDRTSFIVQAPDEN